MSSDQQALADIALGQTFVWGRLNIVRATSKPRSLSFVDKDDSLFQTYAVIRKVFSAAIV
jgi:hypothetical protein